MILVVTDTHFTIKHDDKPHIAYITSCYSDMWAFVDTHNNSNPNDPIKHIIHGGDLMDKRKSMDVHEISYAFTLFINEVNKRNLTVHLILGNHDVYYKSTNSLNSVELLLSGFSNFVVYDKPTVVKSKVA